MHRWGTSVSEYVKNFRIENGLSQGDLGKQIGIHPNVVSKVERGLYQVPYFIVWRMLPIIDDARRGAHLIDLIQDASLKKVAKKLDR